VDIALKMNVGRFSPAAAGSAALITKTGTYTVSSTAQDNSVGVLKMASIAGPVKLLGTEKVRLICENAKTVGT
jgi:hypothetical protein